MLDIVSTTDGHIPTYPRSEGLVETDVSSPMPHLQSSTSTSKLPFVDSSNHPDYLQMIMTSRVYDVVEQRLCSLLRISAPSSASTSISSEKIYILSSLSKFEEPIIESHTCQTKKRRLASLLAQQVIMHKVLRLLRKNSEFQQRLSCRFLHQLLSGVM